MKKVFFWFFIFFASLAFSCSQPKKINILIDQQKIVVNTVQLTNDWKLQKSVDVFGPDYRRYSDSFYVYDNAGITLERRSTLFSSKEDTTILASLVIHFEPAKEGKPHPKKAFSGKLHIDGVEISADFGSSHVTKFQSPWHGRWYEATKGSTYKMSIESTTVYPPFRLYFHFNENGKLRSLSVENTQ